MTIHLSTRSIRGTTARTIQGVALGVSRTTVKQHDGVSFTVLAVNNPALTFDYIGELEGFWDFGPNLTGDFLYIDGSRIPDKSRRRARGLCTSRCFPDAGTYTPTLSLYDRHGGSLTITLPTITVLSLDDLYPGNMTICYSVSGDFTGAPPGADLRVFEGGVVSNMDNRRILFRRGETFVRESSIRIDGRENLFYSAFGPEGDGMPVLYRHSGSHGVFRFHIRGSNPQFKTQFCTVQGLRLTSFYDATAENAWGEEPEQPPNAAVVACDSDDLVGDNTITQCEMDGVDFVHVTQGNQFFFIDNKYENWFVCGPFGRRLHCVGNYIQQPVGTRLGPVIGLGANAWNMVRNGVNIPNTPRSFATRFSNPEKNYQQIGHAVQKNWMYSRNGSTGEDGIATGEYPSVQPCIRLHVQDNNVDWYGSRFSVTENHVTGGSNPITMGAPNAASWGREVDYRIIDANVIELDWSGRSGIGGSTHPNNTFIRNNIIHWIPLPTDGDPLFQVARRMTKDDFVNAASFPESTWMYGNTFIVEHQIGRFRVRKPAVMTKENNVYHFAVIPDGTDGPNEMLGELSDNAPLDALWRPLPGSPAYQSATGKTPRFDFFGNERGALPCQGYAETA